MAFLRIITVILGKHSQERPRKRFINVPGEIRTLRKCRKIGFCLRHGRSGTVCPVCSAIFYMRAVPGRAMCQNRRINADHSRNLIHQRKHLIELFMSDFPVLRSRIGNHFRLIQLLITTENFSCFITLRHKPCRKCRQIQKFRRTGSLCFRRIHDNSRLGKIRRNLIRGIVLRSIRILIYNVIFVPELVLILRNFLKFRNLPQTVPDNLHHRGFQPPLPQNTASVSVCPGNSCPLHREKIPSLAVIRHQIFIILSKYRNDFPLTERLLD